MELNHKKGHIEGRMALAILLNWLAFPTRQDTEMPDLFNRPRRSIQEYVGGGWVMWIDLLPNPCPCL